MMWTHPASIALARNFPHVLIMDCTVKINRFRLPLLEIVGVTSTNLKFPVAFAYLKYEKAENYKWALRNLLKFMKGYPMPNVIVTDLEPELMKAVAVVYPDSRNLLCKWHIIQDIRINCKEMFVRRPFGWECFEWMWSCFVEQVTEESFDRKVSLLKKSYPDALSYISQQWLDPFKDYFLTTNTCMHYGVLVEPEFDKRFNTYYHCNLKLHLDSLKGSFADNWKNINGILVQQYCIIASSFRTSKNIVQDQHGFKPAIFNELRGFVSEFALKKIRSKLKRARDCLTVHFEMPCECNLQATYGLPCAHKLYEFQKNGIPIPLDLVDSHWKNLSMQPPKRRLVKKDNLDRAEGSKNLNMEPKPRLVEENNLDCAEDSKNLKMEPKPRLLEEDNLDRAENSKNLIMEPKPRLVEKDNLDRAEDSKNLKMKTKPRLVEKDNLDRAEDSKNLSMETKPRLVEKDNLDRAVDWKNLSMEPKPRLVEEEILDCAEDLAKFSEFFHEQDAQTRRRLLEELRKIYKPDRITSSGE
ncbi:PREDICTED: uncharacterized protein LOC105972439 [Erythranthe guttata]|uniref:uncharacterized protein LOC105972439 n=1 Tax=Erythranthe guttata TaxID=4155 RepID=UPI00064D8D69|nr:PREDICTED: uncharacterized protein LOC105972439 [Erythranthe guttata]|eukprot:XP_012852853.1 PREDICTED: uncharacterized protein LOC105972439 [Erythranthe guttata]